MSFVVYHTPLCFFAFYFSLSLFWKQFIGILVHSMKKIPRLKTYPVTIRWFFFKEKKRFFFFSPWTLSCSLAILIGCTHGKSISDLQNNALIDLKQPRSTFNRNIFFVRYLFSITISTIIIFLIVFLAFCSPLCQNDLCLSSPLTNFPPSPTYFHGCQKPLTSQKFCLFSSLKKKYLKVKRARFCLY